jgi:hypothetical protein
MEFSKGWVMIFGFVVILLVGLVGLGVNSGDVGLTGNVVGVYSPVSCETSEFVRVWNDVFVRGSSGAVFFSNDILLDGACSGFVGYEIVGNETWAIVSERYDEFDGNVSGVFYAGYSNLSPSGVSMIDGIDEFTGSSAGTVSLVFSAAGFSQNRSSDLVFSGVSSEFSSEFSVDEGLWFDDGDNFRFYDANDVSGFNGTARASVSVEKNNVFYSYIYLNSSNYVTPSAPVLTGDVSNLTFEQNSSWNFGFGFDEHFSYPDGSVFNFSYVGVNNTDGVWIDYDVVNGEALFMPKNKFLGSREFRVTVTSPSSESVVSNTFKVSIVEDVNDIPRLIRNFGVLSLLGGVTLTLNLESYFSDPDGDDLTYRTSDLDNVVVVFREDVMDVSLGDNFSNYETFRVYASDGELERVSNDIGVIRGSSSGSTDPDSNDSIDAAVDGTVVDSQNTSDGGASQQDEDGDGWSIWVWIAIGVVVIFVVGGVVVYFFVFGGAPAVISAPVGGQVQQTTASPVNDYLNNLNLPKK